MQSPKAGVFNKLKKKLTKGRRYEVGSASEECDGTNVKFQKIEVMYGKIPNEDGHISSRDSSPGVRDSPKRSVLDSPQRANLSEKDTNKTNTYTKDPTKEQKKNGSPIKEPKTNKASGPIIFINNTYDLPPVIPIKKGAISDKRQRSKERSKDHGCNKDSKKTEIDKQALGNDHSDENKENSKVIPSACKSPFKSKKEKVNSSVSGKTDASPKQASHNNCIENGDNITLCNKNNSVEGKIKDIPNFIKETDSKGDGEDKGFIKHTPSDINNHEKTDATLNSRMSTDKIQAGKHVDKPDTVVNNMLSKPNIGKCENTNHEINNSTDYIRGNRQSIQSPLSFNFHKVGNPKEILLPLKQVEKQEGNINLENKAEEDDEYERYLLNYGSAANDLKGACSNILVEKKESNCSPNDKDHKSESGILRRDAYDLSLHTIYSLKENSADKDTQKGFVQIEGSSNTCNSLRVVQPGVESGKRKETVKNGKSEYISIEDYGAVVKQKSAAIENHLDDNMEQEDEDEDYDIGYTSLADVEKIFGTKEKIGTKGENKSNNKKVAIGKYNDSNGNLMTDPGRVIKCDVNLQGCNVRPVLVNRLARCSYQGSPGTKRTETTKFKKALPPPITPQDESEYGSIGDYSSNKNKSMDNRVKTQQLGARPKRTTVRTSDDYVPCDSPIVTKVTVVRDMAVKEDSDHEGYTDLTMGKSSRSRDSTSSNLDVNLNIEVERGISHESGYETGGSGLRSHSSSSNEFMQHDSSNYSLTSDQGDDVLVNQKSVNLNDSTSSEETTEIRKGPVCSETIETQESSAVVANLYAFIPKGPHKTYEPPLPPPPPPLTNDCDNGGDSELSGSTDKTETLEHSTIHSPDSITVDTLVDDMDSDAYTDEVDYGFEDCDEEDDDYLPPIPTRNYTADEQKVADSNSNISNKLDNIKESAPPLMRVILNHQDKISTSTKNGTIQSLSLNNVVEKKLASESLLENEKKVTDIKNISATENSKIEKPSSLVEKKKDLLEDKNSKTETIKSPIIKSPVATAKVLPTPKISPSEITNSKVESKVEEHHEDIVKPKVAKIPDINEGLLAKAKSKSVTAMIRSKFSSAVSPFDVGKLKHQNSSPSKEVISDTIKSPTKSKGNKSSNNNNGATARRYKYSPVRKKSYERVERSTPIKDFENLSEKQPTSPVPIVKPKKKNKKGSNESKESLNKNIVEHEKETLVISTSVSNRVSIETLNSDSYKFDKKPTDTPSRFSDKSEELYNQSFSSDSTLSLDQQFWASFEEPVHMSVEEVLTQAKDLGIPLSLSMHGSRNSSGSVSSNESVCSPSHRINSQTLPCPKHGIITQDKLPRKKPGTLKDKFASLFAKKPGSTSPKNEKGSDSIQKRSLPPPPHSRDFDTVDGTIISPSRRRHRGYDYNSKTICQIHGNVSKTLSPSRQGNHFINYSEDNCCKCMSNCHTTSSSKSSSNRNNKQSSSHGNSCSKTCGSCHVCNCNSHGYCVQDSSNHSGSNTTRPSSKQTPCPDHHHQCCQGYRNDHHNTTSNRHQSRSSQQNNTEIHRTRHHSTSGVSHERVRTHHRERSHSRDPTLRSRSPQVHSLPAKHSPGRHSYLSSTQPRHIRSSSSSGIAQRCPPSPAPSTGTSSVLSAPSAFAVPPPSSSNGMSASAAAVSISMLRDCSPTRNSVNDHNGNHNVSANADFIGSLSKLKDVGWYWGPLSWDDAEAKLSTKPDGAFLVRDSSDDRYILSLSFRSQGTTHHTRIEHYKGMFSFYSQPKSHGAATIIEFIEKAMDHSRSGKFLYFLRPRAPGLPPAPVQLLFPISRFHNMQTLQHLCRFSILKHVRRDHIDRLPVPQRIKDYLEMSQYYIEYLGDDTGSR